MSIYLLKTRFQNLLRPLVKLIYKTHITPNMLTSLTCLLSILVAYWVYNTGNKMFILIPIFMFVRMGLNAMDGMLAKEFDMITPLGAILNEMTDVVSDCALYLCFLACPVINQNYLLMVIFISLLTEFAGLCALGIGSKRRFDGPMGKSDRAFIFGLIGLLIFFDYTNNVNAILIFTMVLGMITIVIRIKRALNSEHAQTR